MNDNQHLNFQTFIFFNPRRKELVHGKKNPALRACITSSRIFHAVRAGFLKFFESMTFACSKSRNF
jgi:hypothetical protein